ncbi:hypothetical protein BGZ93_010395 [Podila epicladia]|nr:hypothetical protein BGZ93_010395 [Podila epicladia]
MLLPDQMHLGCWTKQCQAYQNNTGQDPAHGVDIVQSIWQLHAVPEQDREQGNGHDVGREHKGDVGNIGQVELGKEPDEAARVSNGFVDGDDIEDEGGEGESEDGPARGG